MGLYWTISCVLLVCRAWIVYWIKSLIYAGSGVEWTEEEVLLCLRKSLSGNLPLVLVSFHIYVLKWLCIMCIVSCALCEVGPPGGISIMKGGNLLAFRGQSSFATSHKLTGKPWPLTVASKNLLETSTPLKPFPIKMV